ncbi:MAG: TIGR04066 family peptide maturation system protein [Clostridiales bacterium]|nr:TIGR04066 family peptide maturation system protein [Clostridiales bacterium]
MYGVGGERTAVYPYNMDFTPILRELLRRGLLDTDVKLISPPGWGVDGLDAGEAFGRPQLGITIESNLRSALDSVQNLIVAPFISTGTKEATVLIDNLLDGHIHLAISKGLNLIDFRKHRGMDSSEISRPHRIYAEERAKEDLRVDVPVVFISGVMEQVNKFDTLIAISNGLTQNGYKVCSIGARQYCAALGMHSFPSFMFEPIGEVTKIEYFKTFLVDVCKKEKPDVLAICIPGASVKFNNDFPNGYGIVNYLVSMSTTPDFSIVCTNSVEDDMSELDDMYLHRFGYSIDCLVMSNTRVFYNHLERELSFETIDYREVDQLLQKTKKPDSRIPHLNIFNEEHVEILTKQIVEKLGQTDGFVV